MVLGIPDVVAALDDFLAGRLDAVGLEAWAERRECAEDVDFVEADREILVEVIFLLANPSINGVLTRERVEQVRGEILQYVRHAS